MPTPAVKVLAVEISGVDLPSAEEFNLTAENIPFTSAGFDSDNVKDAIVEASQGSDDVHSGHHDVSLSDTIHVLERKQMRIFQQLTVSGGQLINDGWIVVE